MLSVDNVLDNSADVTDSEAEDSSLDTAVDTQLIVDDGVLVSDEERRSGVVKLNVYWSYWMAVGRCLATAVLLSILMMQGLMFSVCVTHGSGINVAYFILAQCSSNSSVLLLRCCWD